jgi:DNA gyrase inhibitor GyrI
MKAEASQAINMTTAPEKVTLLEAPYVYLEKIGPFLIQAPKAWPEFWAIAEGKILPETIESMAGLSRIDNTKQGDDAYIYQAGCVLKGPLVQVPAGLRTRMLKGGAYARFLLTGSYSQLPRAYPAAFSIMEENKMRIRDEFCMEKVLNSPSNTPEDQLKTEILIPTF